MFKKKSYELSKVETNCHRNCLVYRSYKSCDEMLVSQLTNRVVKICLPDKNNQ